MCLQCYSHRHLGWKINVVDACDKEPAGAEVAAATPEDLQSRGSVQYTTRVRPDTGNQRFYGGDGSNAIGGPADKEHMVMPPVPSALEEHLRGDFAAPRPRNEPPRNFTMFAYPSNYSTYGNVPFYMAAAQRYERPRPAGSPFKDFGNPGNFGNSGGFENFASPPQPHFNTYRPVRQPGFPSQQLSVPSIYAQPPTLQPAEHHRTVVMPPRQSPIPVKHGYRVVAGKRVPGAAGGAHRSVVYKKPVFGKFSAVQLPPQFAYRHLQQPPPLQPQPGTAMTQSVSVSYSTSSKLPTPPEQLPVNHQHRATMQSRREVMVGPGRPQFRGGFDPDSVVVEGGFKPMVPTAQDRSDDAQASTPADDPANHSHEKKTNKKLISRKPAKRRADERQEPDRPEATVDAAAAQPQTA